MEGENRSCASHVCGGVASIRSCHQQGDALRPSSLHSKKLVSKLAVPFSNSQILVGIAPPFHQRGRKSPVCFSLPGNEMQEETTLEETFEEVAVAIEKVGRNMRRIEASVDVCAPVYVVWGVLTDYGSLADIIPGLVVNEVLERRPRGAKLLQVGGCLFTCRRLVFSCSKPVLCHVSPMD